MLLIIVTIACGPFNVIVIIKGICYSSNLGLDGMICHGKFFNEGCIEDKIIGTNGESNSGCDSSNSNDTIKQSNVMKDKIISLSTINEFL